MRRDPGREQAVGDDQQHQAGADQAADAAEQRADAAHQAAHRRRMRGIEPGIGHIRDQVGQDEDEGEDHDDPLHQHEIALLDRGQQAPCDRPLMLNTDSMISAQPNM